MLFVRVARPSKSPLGLECNVNLAYLSNTPREMRRRRFYGGPRQGLAGAATTRGGASDGGRRWRDIVRVEKKFYGAWSPETRQLLADGDALAAYKRRAFDLYRRRFAPEALLRRVDAWNERGAPDAWQDKST